MRLAGLAGGGSAAGIGIDSADLDLGVARARIVSLLGGRRGGGCCRKGEHDRRQPPSQRDPSLSQSRRFTGLQAKFHSWRWESLSGIVGSKRIVTATTPPVMRFTEPFTDQVPANS